MRNPKVDANAKPLPRSLSGYSRPSQTGPVDASKLMPPEPSSNEKPSPRIQGNMIDLR